MEDAELSLCIDVDSHQWIEAKAIVGGILFVGEIDKPMTLLGFVGGKRDETIAVGTSKEDKPEPTVRERRGDVWTPNRYLLRGVVAVM